MFKRFFGALSVLRFIWRHPLNASSRLRAVIGFVKWQIGTRCLDARIVIPWIEDARFIVGKGEAGLTGNLYSGFMEFEEMVFVLHVLRRGDTFLDVGANVGAYSILASKVVGAKSLSFEPVPSTYDRLLDQVHINRIESLVDARNCGVGSNVGVLHFTVNSDTVNKVTMDVGGENAVGVDVTTLDSVVSGDGSYLLKIDVEGFEAAVLAGGARLLSSGRVYAVVVEMNGSGSQYGYADEDVHASLIAHGFSPVFYDPIGRHVSVRDGFGGVNGNTLYVRDIREISQRCADAPLRVVHTARGIRL